MLKEETIVFIIFVTTITLLISHYYQPPLEIHNEEEFNQASNNDLLKLYGEVESVSIREKYLSFEINSISLRSSSKKIQIIENDLLTITGSKKTFDSYSWIETTKIEYDN